jgi:ribonuclease P protein component
VGRRPPERPSPEQPSPEQRLPEQPFPESPGTAPECRPIGRFSPGDRIRKRSEFRAIQDAGYRVVSPAFVFLLGRTAPRAGRQGVAVQRLGVTASRRVGNAIQRNRAKRLLREAFRCVRAGLPTGLDLVVIVRQSLGSRTLADVVSEWQSCRVRIARRFAAVPAVAGPVRAAPVHSDAPSDPVALAVKNSC